MEKTVKDLTNKEIVEDLFYWIQQAWVRSPPFVDNVFKIIYKYVCELEERFKK